MILARSLSDLSDLSKSFDRMMEAEPGGSGLKSEWEMKWRQHK